MDQQQFEGIFCLLILFQFKHFIADFPLQREYMLGKVSPGWDFVLPLALHCGVHGLGTLLIALFFRPELAWLAILDFLIHFIIDRIKSGPRYLGRYQDVKKSSFWITLGFDQMLHHLTHILIIWFLVVY